MAGGKFNSVCSTERAQSMNGKCYAEDYVITSQLFRFDSVQLF